MTAASHPKPTWTVVVQPIALTKPQAAAALGVSVDSFERYVQPHVKVIRRGRIRLFAVSELQRWASEASEHTLSNPHAPLEGV